MRYTNLNPEETGTSRLQNRNRVYGSILSRSISTFTRTEHDKKILEQRKKESETKLKTISTIFDYIYSDKTISELLVELHSNEEHRKYANFFENWIHDALLKKQDMIDTINQKRREGKNNEEIIEYLKKVGKYRNYIKYANILVEADYKDDEKGIEPGDE